MSGEIKKCVGLLFGLLLMSTSIQSQTKGIYSQNHLNKYQLNPAYAGFDFSLSVSTQYRKQWQDIKGSPSSVYLGAHLPFYIWNGAIGLQVEQKSMGALSLQTFDASYNYIFSFLQGFMSLGARVGGAFASIDGQQIRTVDGDYTAAYDHRDPILEVVNMGGSGIQYSVGMYYFSKILEAGFSLDNIHRSSLFFKNFNLDNSLTYSGLLSYKTRVLNNIKLRPTVTVYGNADNLQIQAMLHSEYSGSIFGGIGMRGYTKSSMESIIFLIGSQVSKNIRISYSYDVGIASYADFHSGSHEILINYNFNKPIGTGVNQKIIYNTRNL